MNIVRLVEQWDIKVWKRERDILLRGDLNGRHMVRRVRVHPSMHHPKSQHGILHSELIVINASTTKARTSIVSVTTPWC